MKNYTTSKKLLKNIINFKKVTYYSFLNNILQKKGTFHGWGRKKSGLKAIKLAKKHSTSFLLLEDGFIRSLFLGVDGSPSFSLVEDDIGIYYDATTPSKLENILNNYDFKSDEKLMKDVNKAITLMRENNISKYNNAPDIKGDFFQNSKREKVLVIAQTAGDASLKYGMLDDFTTDDMIREAIKDNPSADIYIKIHPDVLRGKKKSDIDIKNLNQNCIIIEENVNPLSLLKHFMKVYTKTSQMGFEALLVGCKSVCFGMPFYAGWGVSIDKSVCSRRKRVLTIEEIFAGAYILYTRYYNPYTKKESDIFDTIETLIELKKER